MFFSVNKSGFLRHSSFLIYFIFFSFGNSLNNIRKKLLKEYLDNMRFSKNSILFVKISSTVL